VIAFHATDHTTTEILHIDHGRHELIVDIRQEQIRTRDRLVVFVPQLVDQMVDCAGDIDLAK
jgi:hypothetical protein